MGREAKRNAAMRKLMEAAKELGWSVAIESTIKDDEEVPGLVMGTDAWLSQFDTENHH